MATEVETGGTAVETPAAAPGTPASTSTPAVVAATPASPTGFTYTEDRSKWIPPHRFNEVSQQARRAADLESQIAERDRKIQALAGVTPKDSEAAKAESIKEALFQIMPQLRVFADRSVEEIQQILETPQYAARQEQTELRGWQRHGNQQMDIISERVAEAIGADKLDADQQADLRDGFASWLKQKAQAELQASDGAESKTLARYEDGDEKLLDEFVSRYTKNWVEPARRRATASTTARIRPTVSSTGRAQVTSLKRPEKFANLDERIEYAANLAKERGAQFGR